MDRPKHPTYAPYLDLIPSTTLTHHPPGPIQPIHLIHYYTLATMAYFTYGLASTTSITIVIALYLLLTGMFPLSESS